LLEIIPKRGSGPVEHATVPKVLELLYDRGLKPDWWKLPSMPRAGLWREIAEVVERRDGACRGVLVLGLDAPFVQLADSFKLTAGIDVVKGFAVGRTLWSGPTTEWLAGRIDDATLIHQVAEAFEKLLQAWRTRSP
jgi:5-dehydro-2-deoxygluconokinase